MKKTTTFKTLLLGMMLLGANYVEADVTLFTAPTDNGDGTYSLNGSTYTKTTYSFTTEPSKGSAASKESASSQASGYTDAATTRYKIQLSGSSAVSDMISGLTFTNTNGSAKYIYFCSNYGLQADEGEYVTISVTGQSERTLAVLHYVTAADNTKTIVEGTTHTIAKKGANISFKIGTKNAVPYYLYTSIDVYEETKVGDFVYESTTGYYKKNGANYQRTTYDFQNVTIGSEQGTGPSGFTNATKRYKSSVLSKSTETTNLIDGLSLKAGGDNDYVYTIPGCGMQVDVTTTLKPTTSDPKTVAYLYYKVGASPATNLTEEVAESYSIVSGTTSSFSMTSKNSAYSLYTTMVVFQEVGVGDYYSGGDGFYYTASDLVSKTTPYARDTYDFTSYTFSTDTKTGTDYNPTGFSDKSSNTKYQTTISSGYTNTNVPAGLTFGNTSGSDGYLQYYKNMGMQAGTKPLTLTVTNATANTVSYLYYKQGKAEDKTTVALTEESAPITISGTATETLYQKDGVTNPYRLYTRLEVFTKDVTATIGTNGYATFASPYPLDLTTANMPEGLTAYKAAVSGTTVTFTLLNQTVPANTGILLQGEASGLYDIPVVASGTEVTENAFLVNTGGTTFAGDEDYYYFGLKKNTLTFGTFTPGTLAIPANKAYLKVAKSNFGGGAARELSFSFGDDETTRVETMNHALGSAASLGEEPITVNQYYDLQGRRVAQPTRGLYIVNGKKVVVK